LANLRKTTLPGGFFVCREEDYDDKKSMTRRYSILSKIHKLALPLVSKKISRQEYLVFFLIY
ncbi:hypothetical protein O5964_26275, partial [Escherichia coli]|nr:hypothetical protein [Escherichia coli]